MIVLFDGQLICIQTVTFLLNSSEVRFFCKILHLVLVSYSELRDFQEFKFGEQLNRRQRCKASL